MEKPPIKIPVKDFYEEYVIWQGKTIKITVLVKMLQDCIDQHNDLDFEFK